jgi:primosomal protein N' (replication factor Y)
MPHFVEVILPLALPQNFTYSLPDDLYPSIAVGKRVIVQFGKRKLYTALVLRIHQIPPEGFEPKPILEVEDELAIVDVQQTALWQWIADYYMCTLGEVMTAALPAGLKLESETRIVRNHLKQLIDEELTDHEYLIVEALEGSEALSIKEIADIIDVKNPLRIIQNLLGKHYILLEEELKSGYKPKQKRYVKLAAHISESDLNKTFEGLNGAPKQADLLLSYFKLGASIKEPKAIVAARLLKHANASGTTLKSLEKKGVFEVFFDVEEKTKGADKETKNLKSLTSEQENAFKKIQENFESQDVNLLHGVTSSGKTEVYVKLIAEQLDKNKQVLYLVPEIALTTQLINRLRQYFGDTVLVYHSRFSDRERVETWLRMREAEDQPALVLGARSSIFLPFKDLGLIIVDEEHESSFKQYDPAPRYHARDTAVVLAKIHQAKVLLGSATPAFETFHNAQQKKYGYVSLTKRFGDLPLPEIQCVDLKDAYRKKKMRGHFSETLLEHIEETIKAGKQVILFQNRRGFNSLIQCRNCAHVNQCKNCDISLTYHKHIDLLRCHYCGFTRPLPKKCPACGSIELKPMGFGTEKLEEDLSLMLPNISVKRMDLDTTRKKNAYANIISSFEDGEIDVLVGTQMVTKGLDFENVALVGVMNADTLLNFPDFRAHERAFQLLAQVAGRAGRKRQRGKVLIQTSEPYHNTIRHVMENNYQALYQSEVSERKQFHYPPYIRLIKVILKHRKREVLLEESTEVGKMLRGVFGVRLLGPEFPMVPRLRNFYIMEMWLKLENGISHSKAKVSLREKLEYHFQHEAKSRLQVIYDVDPL